MPREEWILTCFDDLVCREFSVIALLSNPFYGKNMVCRYEKRRLVVISHSGIAWRDFSPVWLWAWWWAWFWSIWVFRGHAVFCLSSTSFAAILEQCWCNGWMESHSWMGRNPVRIVSYALKQCCWWLRLCGKGERIRDWNSQSMFSFNDLYSNICRIFITNVWITPSS